ncbi:hypothetical protein SEA_THORONGIL_42 [Microbacterium phage Thorongil]|uniref:Uncharacterized protein n=1 Tax=Microbacterium phage Thorongil TaxID=2790990 RepID=A0A7T3N396_9CAUD|nr:hypothetical protein SEA_THORONGIL_42 [Microbacterium phage Thorongil]
MIPWWWLLVSLPVGLIVGAVVGVGLFLLSMIAEWGK